MAGETAIPVDGEIPPAAPGGPFARVIGVMNALGHTIATVLGHTVSTVQFPRPAPGFYSSPLLLIVSIYALRQLRQTRHLPPVP